MTLTILGIETSCDETAAAIVQMRHGRGVILSNIVHSQIDIHAVYGGVVPELAARAHGDYVEAVVAQALDEAGLSFTGLDAVAATAGPGLVGGLLVGLTAGKALAVSHDLPFIPINHLEGHALTVRLSDRVLFPYLLLLVSGGHCQLLGVLGVGSYRLYGTTRDDAVGEAFDKAAKLLGLGYPGGPEIEARARLGDSSRFVLPRPMLNMDGCDFSFSGLKTALMRIVRSRGLLSNSDINDLAAGFQAAAIACLEARSLRALDLFAVDFAPSTLRFVIAGGVAANVALREVLAAAVAVRGGICYYPPLALCGDNAAMIAWVAAERMVLCRAGDAQNGCGEETALAMAPKPRWSLI